MSAGRMSLLPTLVFAPELLRKSHRRVERGTGFAAQGHVGFFRGAVALALIAAFASRHHIVPTVGSPFGEGHDMIQGQIVGAATILAGVVIPPQNLPPIHRGHAPSALFALDGQANMFGHFNDLAGGAHLPHRHIHHRERFGFAC
jgi:hypothetical protein